MSRKDGITWSTVVLKWVTVLLIVKVLFSILSNDPDYFPPNFESDFLLERKEYFAGAWRRAVQRNFPKHRYWMTRCFVMLCSAVVLRLISGAATVFGADAIWTYPLAAWAAWIVPLCSLEFYEYFDRKGRWQRPPRG